MTTAAQPEVIDPEESCDDDFSLGPTNYPEVKITALVDRHVLLDDELRRIEDSLKRIDKMKARIKYPDELCRIILTEQKLLEARRKHLLLPFGFTSGNRPSKADEYYDT